MAITLAQDTIEQSEIADLCTWMQANNRLTKGPLCVAFEEAFAQWQGSKHAVFVNSGSSANLLMAQALLEAGRLRNNIIIAPSVSWVTTVTPFMQLGFDVKLCDCDTQNLGLDIDHLEQLCKEYQPSCIILVHVLGHANHMKAINDICDRYDVVLIEDSCESLGSILDGKKLGSIGLAGSFSFYYGHHISTIEGGMVVTDDTELYHIMLSIRSHGWGRDVPKDVHASWQADYEIDEVRDLYTFYYSGFNLRSTDLNAYLGLSQLKKLDAIAKKRAHNAERYAQNLSDFWCQTSDVSLLSSFAYATFVENRLQVYQRLKDADIESRPLICGNIGLHPFWIKRYGKASFAHADQVHHQGMYLPNHYHLSDADIDRVCEVVQEVAKPFDLD